MAATFGRRLRKGAASTAVAALALAALTASQAPGAAESRTGSEAKDPASAGDTPIDGGSPYYTDLPPLNSPVRPGGSPGSGGPVVTGPAEAGIPATVLDAYKKAEAQVARTQPGCRLPWQLLAAIGKVESGHARGGAVDAEGTTLQRITGPQLNGKGFAMISDTDHGVFDGDTTHDRAVGPMQFIPSTWSKGGPDGKGWGADGNGDGLADPNNIYDAALGAGRYLCANGRDLGTQSDLDKAVLGYNPSREYLNTVLSWLAFYRKGTHEVPDGKGLLPVHRGGVSNGQGTKPTPGAGSTPGRTTGPGAGRSGGTTPEPGGNGSGKPTTPSKPTTPPAKPGTHEPEPTKPPTTPPTKPPTKPTPAPVAALEQVGAEDLTATVGEDFGQIVRVRAKDTAGKPVAGVPVEFRIVGETGARFPGKADRVTVRTGADGIATAPRINAGDKAGGFTVRATAVGRQVPAAETGATVKAKPAPAPKADALARTSDAKLTAKAGTAFAEGAVEIKATYRGKIAAGAAVTATMVTDDPKQPVENDKGPYFAGTEDKDAGKSGSKDSKDGDKGAGRGADKEKQVRSLTLKTGADGLLKLPEIRTDQHAGTFLLRLTTADGAVLTVELTVTA